MGLTLSSQSEFRAIPQDVPMQFSQDDKLITDKFMFKKPTIFWGATETRYDDLNFISEEAWNKLYHQYSELPNVPLELQLKRIGLKSLGLEDEEIEEMCKPIEFNREQIMKEVARLCVDERKQLRKWNKQRKLEEQNEGYEC